MMQSVNHLKAKLARDETTFGLWVTLADASVTEIATMLEFDWVVIDTEHGHLDYREVIEHLRATRGSMTTPLVRVSENTPGIIKRMLDLGAQGIIAPQVMNRSDVENAVRCAKYPPIGIRGVGGERATHWGRGLKSDTAIADRETMVIPLLETVPAGQDLDQILEVGGLDAIFFGPADYSASSGYLGEWEGPGVAQTLLGFQRRISDRGIPCGIMATGIEDLAHRKNQGFRMIGLGADTGFLIRAAASALELARAR
jgi:2-keto-3-deoxy-L-rhamnonate aldolase RhmA